MAQLKKEIVVTITVESIRDRLYKMLVSEHSALIADVIIGNLNPTSVGLEQLYKAMSGIKDTLKYQVGDHVLIKKADSFAWKYSDDKMTEAGLMVKNYLKATIITADIYRKDSYKIKYLCVTEVGQEEASQYVPESQLILEEDWSDIAENLPF